eukprot:TRINITY_DN3310_c0_g2_i2.p4 TRINITY_DN3310_c0_g2~~TRINITY_DN3310_c0_g2_i2.p4  ORF type:complete len:191 (-),score=-9.99 TRINITY_DN3310_c0_g2_i2:781-1353(-)
MIRNKYEVKFVAIKSFLENQLYLLEILQFCITNINSLNTAVFNQYSCIKQIQLYLLDRKTMLQPAIIKIFCKFNDVASQFDQEKTQGFNKFGKFKQYIITTSEILQYNIKNIIYKVCTQCSFQSYSIIDADTQYYKIIQPKNKNLKKKFEMNINGLLNPEGQQNTKIKNVTRLKCYKLKNTSILKIYSKH